MRSLDQRLAQLLFLLPLHELHPPENKGGNGVLSRRARSRLTPPARGWGGL
jgi:hypothetical protein